LGGWVGRVANAHVGTDDEAAAFDCGGAHQGEPGVAPVGGRGEVEVDILREEGLSHKRHVVLPADGGREVDAHTTDGGAYGPERGGRALGPDEAFGSGLRG
jgi:hypothetical protein